MKSGEREDWNNATLLPAKALKARRAFNGNWSVRTSFSFVRFSVTPI